MSTKDNTPDTPEEPEAAAPVPAVPLAEIFDEDFLNKTKGRAAFWKNHLNKEVKAQIFENEKYKTFFEKSGIREKWETKMSETGDYEDLDVETLQDVVTLHSDYTEFKKDVKQVTVYEKKRALARKRDELKDATDQISEAGTKIGELSEKLEELKQVTDDLTAEAQKVNELKEKITGLQEEIDGLDKDLYEARETRKDEDRLLLKKLKEYVSKIHLPEPPAPEEEHFEDDRSATPPTTPESEVDSEFSQKPEPKKPAKKQPVPPKKGKKATVEDAD